LRTELISSALALGLPATGGLGMLVAQAAAATECFLDCRISENMISNVLAKVEAQKQNIVLIGMPSCGKTTVGHLLSESLHCPLIDTDEVFYKTVGTRAGDYIQSHGEAAFRELEALLIRQQIASQSGAVIATGGGAILKDENVRRLKRNGKLYFLDRSLASLEVSCDRPLSADRDALRRRYEERYDRYCAVADVHVSIADGERPEETARRILASSEEEHL
jgi:shikimate dehydrogenase